MVAWSHDQLGHMGDLEIMQICMGWARPMIEKYPNTLTNEGKHLGIVVLKYLSVKIRRYRELGSTNESLKKASTCHVSTQYIL